MIVAKNDRHIINCSLSLWTGGRNACRWCDAELEGRRTRWCSDRCARLYLKNHRWTDARKAARRRDKYACTECGSPGPLEVNHIVPVMGKHNVIGCHHHLDGLDTLCHECHKRTTAAQFGYKTAVAA